MSCNSCYEISLPACRDIIAVKLGLAADSQFTWVITDKFGNKYSEEVTTDGSGNFEVDTTELPDELFNAYAGKFILTIINSGDQTQAFEINDTEYSCIAMSFHESDKDEADDPAVIPNNADTITTALPEGLFPVYQIEFTAAENIGRHQVVTTEGKVANTGTIGDATKILGVANSNVLSGNKGIAIVKGFISDPTQGWTFTPDADLYLNGTSFSETAPTSGFSIVIAKAIRSDAYVVNIGSPTILP